MLGIVLRILAAIAFFVAAVNQTVLKQTPHELVAWGLFLWVVATLVGGWGPTFQLSRRAE
jgi:hypothetical protein